MDPLSGEMTRELIPCDSFEWQRIVRRIKMQTTTKLVALLMSTYANRDGSHIIVGVVRLVAVTDTSKATIVRHLEALRSMGLIERVRQGNRHTGDADEYRLTVPSDVLDLPMLDPDERDESGDR